VEEFMQTHPVLTAVVFAALMAGIVLALKFIPHKASGVVDTVKQEQK
jgi:hypothetical protein